MSTPRPRSVTLGCVYGGLGGVLATVTLFETLQNWGSIEMQETLRSGLSQVGASGDVDTLMPILRWVVMGLMVAAIAATVFALHASKGHQASRVGLTALAGLAAVAFGFAGVSGLLPAVLAGLIVYLLWSRPAREWFAVVNGRTPLSLGAAPSVQASTTTQAPPHRTEQPAPPGTVPPAYDPSQHPQHARQAPVGRPRAVTIALFVAGLGSAAGAALSGLVLLALVAMREQVIDQYSTSDLLQGQLDGAGISPEQMVTLGTWLFGVWLAISALGLVATAMAATGSASGRWALIGVSIVTAGAGALGLPLGLAWIVGAIVVIVQVSKPEAKAWFGRA